MRREGEGRRRLRRSVVVGPVLVLAGVCAVLVAEVQHARGLDYVDDPEFDVAHRTGGEGTALLMVVLGDSTVAGLGVDELEHTLPVQVAEQVAAATGRVVDVRGHGESGATTLDVLERQLPTAADGDVLVIEVGSNDVTHLTSLDEVEARTRTLLERAQERYDLVVLGSAGRLDTDNFLPPLRQLVVWRARRVRERQAAAAAAAGVGFVDMGGRTGDEFDRTPGAISPDRFHPAAPGYEVWARALANEVVARLDERER